MRYILFLFAFGEFPQGKQKEELRGSRNITLHFDSKSLMLQLPNQLQNTRYQVSLLFLDDRFRFEVNTGEMREGGRSESVLDGLAEV